MNNRKQLDRYFLAALLLSAALVVGFQVFGGAYQAEFDGHADEAAHFVSALLVRDYLGQWPPPDPLPWAAQYYLHYPKVAIGQWPPGYYVVQALWWLVFPVSRASALWLHVFMSLIGMGLFYLLARRLRPGWPAVCAGALLFCTPVVQQSNAMIMSDLQAMVAALVLLWVLTRLLESPSFGRLGIVVAALAWALAIKGTGVALFPAPLLALALTGAGKRLQFARVAGALALLGVCVAAAYLWQYHGSLNTVRNWAGMTTRVPWRIDLLPALAGAGCLALAVLGIGIAWRGRQPATVAAASVLLSLVGCSYFIRAIREPRHWIAALPALLLLNLAVYALLERRWPRLAPVAVLLALVCFPFSLYRQKPEGFRELAAQLPLPARMLVSSPLGWSEGPWIATVAAAESRPKSTIARATKLLAATNWNGEKYQLLVHTDQDLERVIDESALDIIVLHNSPEVTPVQMPHHALLRGYVSRSHAWRLCARAHNLEAYCRLLPPRYPRKPLRIDLRSRIGYEVEER